MLKIWPVNSFDIKTSFSPEKILSILQLNTEPKKWFRVANDHKYFEGEFFQQGFKIQRIIRYKNSFAPVITGLISHEGAGSIVKIKMKLPPFVIAFLMFWFAGVIVASVALAVVVVTNPAEANSKILIPLGMFVSLAALVCGGFWFEAQKQHDKLIALLKA